MIQELQNKQFYSTMFIRISGFSFVEPSQIQYNTFNLIISAPGALRKNFNQKFTKLRMECRRFWHQNLVEVCPHAPFIDFCRDWQDVLHRNNSTDKSNRENSTPQTNVGNTSIIHFSLEICLNQLTFSSLA